MMTGDKGEPAAQAVAEVRLLQPLLLQPPAPSPPPHVGHALRPAPHIGHAVCPTPPSMHYRVAGQIQHGTQNESTPNTAVHHTALTDTHCSCELVTY